MCIQEHLSGKDISWATFKDKIKVSKYVLQYCVFEPNTNSTANSASWAVFDCACQLDPKKDNTRICFSYTLAFGCQSRPKYYCFGDIVTLSHLHS